MLFNLLFVALIATSAIAKPLNCKTRHETKCKGACTNVQTDPNNCGSCGNACSATYTCDAGKCTAPTSNSPCTQASSCGHAYFCDIEQLCICIEGSNGQLRCHEQAETSCGEATYCTEDSDCTASPGGFCAQKSCCSDLNGGHNICVYPDSCSNGSAPSKLFRRGTLKNHWLPSDVD